MAVGKPAQQFFKADLPMTLCKSSCPASGPNAWSKQNRLLVWYPATSPSVTSTMGEPSLASVTHSASPRARSASESGRHRTACVRHGAAKIAPWDERNHLRAVLLLRLGQAAQGAPGSLAFNVQNICRRQTWPRLAHHVHAVRPWSGIGHG